MTQLGLIAATCLACAAACGRSDVPVGQATPVPESAAASSALPPAPSAAGPRSDAGAQAARTWSGTYKAAAGSLYVPEDWKVRWHPDDVTSGVGEGPLSITVDPARGVVEGAVGGPLGPATLNGQLSDGLLGATMKRRDPQDHGFTGVLRGSARDGGIEGTLNVSPATGGAVRVGTFTLAPGAQ